MIHISKELAKRTGLSEAECNDILIAISYEILEGVIDNRIMKFEGLGSIRRDPNVYNPRIMQIYLQGTAWRRLKKRSKRRTDEIVLK